MRRGDEEAIVLDQRPTGEADRVVTLLTAEGRRLVAFAPRAARSRRRFPGGLQPGAVLRARWRLRRGEAMPLLEESRVLAPPPRPEPLERYWATAHVVELGLGFAREGEDDPRLFRLVRAVLASLAAGGDPWTACRYAELWVLLLAGLFPDLDTCGTCGAPLAGGDVLLVPEQGAFCADHAPPGAGRLPALAVRWLVAARHLPPDRVPAAPPGAAEALETVLPGLVRAFLGRPLRALASWPRAGGADGDTA